jgi:hypothetical protein
MGVVTTKDDIQSNLKKRGIICMFVGYSMDRAKNFYQILNLHTERIINTLVEKKLKCLEKESNSF